MKKRHDETGPETGAKPNRPLTVWLPAVRTGSGADVYVQRLSAALERAGHRPIVQWFPHRFEIMPWRLKAVQAPEETDIIHANSWQGSSFKREGIPLVITEHHYIRHQEFLPYRTRLQRIYHSLFIHPLLRRSYVAADAIVAVSKNTAEALEADIGRPVPYIHNWIDTEQFKPSCRAERNQSNRPFRLLFVGNPQLRKGSDLLPRLAEILGPEFQIACLGGLRKGISKHNGATGLATLPPFAPDKMHTVYNDADAALILARYEAFGYVALEAMACGLPVVGFDTTGTAEICVDKETGFLVKVDDLDSLSSACRMLKHDKELQRRFAKRGRSRAISLFNEAPAIRSYIKIYRQLTRKR